MADKNVLTEAEKEAIGSLIQKAVARLDSLDGLDRLEECRRLFRKSVPLHRRAYVAAALLLAASGQPGRGNGKFEGRRGRDGDASRRGSDGARPGSGRNQPEIGTGRKQDKPASGALSQADKSGGRAPRQEAAKSANPDAGKPAGKQASKQSRDLSSIASEPAEKRAAPKRRETRFRGDGVTLFVGAGRRQRFYARIALDYVFGLAGVREEHIGDVRTMDNYSFITVDPAVEELVTQGLSAIEFKGRLLVVNKARKRDDSDFADEQPMSEDAGYSEDEVLSEGTPAGGGAGDDEYLPENDTPVGLLKDPSEDDNN